jgi:3-hydroxy-9,10-secoandrosta-1,3,5(10)-triene-9,17-dione monooxygenase
LTTKLTPMKYSLVDADVDRIIGLYSEADREELSSELLDVLRMSDVVKILDESRAAGPGSLRDVLRVCQKLGKTDASLAWVVGVSNSAWSTRGCFHSLESADPAIERNRILAMVLGRPGSLKKDASSGAYLLNGEWKYASGWKYSSYFFCLAVVEGAAVPDIRMVAVPAGKLSLIGDWQATGLRGTQSVTLRAVDVEIPDCNMEDYSRILSGENRAANRSGRSENQASYSGLFTGVLMNCLMGSMLGATEAALEFVAAAADKFPIVGSTYTSMSASGAIRAELGRLHSALDLYKRAAEYNADVIDKSAIDSSIALTTQDRVDSRGRVTQVMRGCVDIVQDLLWIYGSSGLDKGCVLERIWRDVNVGARHGGFSKFVPEEAVGLAFIGRDPTEVTRMF